VPEIIGESSQAELASNLLQARIRNAPWFIHSLIDPNGCSPFRGGERAHRGVAPNAPASDPTRPVLETRDRAEFAAGRQAWRQPAQRKCRSRPEPSSLAAVMEAAAAPSLLDGTVYRLFIGRAKYQHPCCCAYPWPLQQPMSTFAKFPHILGSRE